MSTDYAAVTARQQQVWSAGDFARIGTTQVIVGENLCEAVDVHPGERVLRRDLLGVFARSSRAGDGTLIMGADYLEVVAVRA